MAKATEADPRVGSEPVQRGQPTRTEKPVYQLDEDGYLLFETVADLSPLDWEINGQEVWHIPSGCVEARPPKAKKGHRLRFVAGKWTQEKLPESPPATEPALDGAAPPPDPVAVLAAFLSANPDVAALIKGR